MSVRATMSFVARHKSIKIVRRLSVLGFGVAVLAGGSLLGQNLFTHPQAAGAATPPESCFAYTTASNKVTITNYYANEGNNSANPACPRAVDIPASLGGNPVVAIGNNVFNSMSITTVTIPSSVTSIGSNAFSNNQLTTVTIPSSVASIGSSAFSNNQLATVTIPGNPTTLGDDILYNNLIATISYSGTTYSVNQPVSETCYKLSAGTITDFYYAELAHIKTNSEACLNPNLAIPNQIGGTQVTGIGSDAFSHKNLTSVTIPSSATNIGSRAFMDNQLTTVSIPEGVTSIDWYTFYGNRLSEVNIPDSLTFIETNAFFLQNEWGGHVAWEGAQSVPYIWSDDPTEMSRLFDSIWYVRLYTASPDNPNNLKDSSISEEWDYGYDTNNDGTTANSIGGHIINPARTTVNLYGRTGSTALSTAQLIVGAKTNGGSLSDYSVTASAISSPLDPTAPTPTEQTTMDTGFAQYNRLGQTKSFTAPVVPGYTLLSPASPVAKVLSAHDNTVDFRYAKTLSSVDFASPSGSSTNPTTGSVPAGLSSVLSHSVFSVDASKGCSVINSAKLLPSSGFNSPVDGYSTVGGLDFSIDCSEPGKDASVSLTLGKALTDPTKAKVYKKTTSGVTTDITSQVSLTNKTVGGVTRTVLSYSITDGGTLDDDGIANGSISDPIYIVVPTGELADTGTNVVLYVAVSVAVLIAAGVLWVMPSKKRYQLARR